MKTTETGVHPCPQCGAPNDMATSWGGDDSPEPGDVSLCVGCGTVLVFNDDMSSRKPTPDEEVEIFLAMPAEFRAKFLEVQAMLKATAPKADPSEEKP